MAEEIRNPQIDSAPLQINSAKIAAGGNIAGAIFTVGSMAILLVGLPQLWYMFPAALVLGGGVALTLHFIRHEAPGKSWILSAPKK